MKIKYLGTAAAEGIPAIFCTCRVCQNAILKKGKEIRSRSQALINDDLLIDFGPDTFAHMAYEGLATNEVQDILITHSHEDHLQVDQLFYISSGFAAEVKPGKFHVYCFGDSYDRVNKMLSEIKTDRMDAVEVLPYHTYKIRNYDVTPLKANHDPHSSPVMYLIDDGEKVLLYAHDTGLFPKETMEYLLKMKKKIDLISLDCTAAFLTNWRDNHLTFDVFLELVDELKKNGVLTQKCKVVANHFSHNGKATHEEMCEFGLKHDVIISYDGLEVEI